MIQIVEITPERIAEFWDAHIRYLVDDGIISDEEDVAYFSGAEYRGILLEHMARQKDKQHMVWFVRDGVKIGAASYCIYQSEDGKCFLLDFWVFPEYRGTGAGHQCFAALEQYTKADGAVYYELNSEKAASVRFWKSLGFTENGTDEWDMPLFVKRVHSDRRKTVKVAAAVIRDGKRIFATQRGYGDYKDYWEFPGGKIEPGETPQEALVREIREELDTVIEVEDFLTTVEYDYPEFHLSMDCFWANVVEGELVLKEHEAARWLNRDELDSVPWLPADRIVVAKIKEIGRERK